MEKFIVDGSVRLRFEMTIEAENEQAAKKKCKEMLEDMYHFNVFGAYHDPKHDVIYDIDVETSEQE